MGQTTLHVTGMGCTGCEQTVTDALSALEGVTAVAADYETDQVRVDHDPTLEADRLRTTIVAAGYEVPDSE